MGFLKILKVIYSGEKYFFESPIFENRLSIIEGPNGVGKSTFFSLIYFGLGGKVAEFESQGNELHPEITEDRNNYVELLVSISGQEYSLIRKFRDNSITVNSAQENIDTAGNSHLNFPVFRGKDASQPIFSDWILEKLGIPVVDIYQAGRNFKLNFTDLMRLIYHNQAPDPQGIFKPADNSNFISDSLEIRRAIFQILVGKTLLALYEAIGAFKRAEHDYDAAKSLVKEYEKIVSEILKANGINEVRNSVHLAERISEVNAQLEKLISTRESYAASPIATSGLLKQLDHDKKRLGELEIDIRKVKEEIGRLVRDKNRIYDVEQAMKEDIARVSKVLHTHKQLNLFSSDTCPYCLNVVSRTENHCVCGSKVDENDYQRFFYDSGEYVEILQTKIKSFDTLLAAAKDIDNELQLSRKQQAELEEKATALRFKVDETFALSSNYNRDAFREELDEKIFELKNVLNELDQAFRMESKLGDYQRKSDSAKKVFDSSRNNMMMLDIASKVELQNKLSSFNATYNTFLTTVLAECRVASIDTETYLPIINNGQYREASADVPKRFLYYLTLLKLSLTDDIPFPRVLFVDTPETAGIDKDNLVRLIRQISVLNEIGKDYQILLSTGIEKYPPEFVDSVVIKLGSDDKLLKLRESRKTEP